MIPADRRLTVVDNGAGGGIGIVGSGRVWLAVHRTSRDPRDLRHDTGALALKVRTATGWADLLAPRPLTAIAGDSGGPALLRRGVALRPVGFGMDVGRSSADIRAGYYVKRRLHARIGLRWSLTRGGARLRVSGAEPGEALPDAGLHARGDRDGRAARARGERGPAGGSARGSACGGSPATIPGQSSAWMPWRQCSELRGPGASPCGSGAEHEARDAIAMRRPVLILLLVLAALAAVPAGAHAFQIGMSDQKLGMWQDPRFERLGIRHVRLLVYYNLVLKGDFSRYDAWMRQAHARGDDVLLTINQHSSMSTRALPTLRQYRRVVRKLRARYPWVRTWAAWNEANHKKQPLFRKPRRAAQFYNVHARRVPRLHDRRRRRARLEQHAAVAGDVQALRAASADLGPAQLHGHEPLQAAAGDVDARAAAGRPRAGLADGDGRDRPLRRPLPRRPARPSAARPGRSGGRSASRRSARA